VRNGKEFAELTRGHFCLTRCAFAAAAAAAAAAALVLFAPSFATMAVWETVEAVEHHVEALDDETRDVLQPVLHRLVRLRGLHESTLPQEQQLRRTHVALLSELRLYAEKLRAIHFHAQTAAMGEAALGALPADEHQFLASLQRLLGRRKS